MIDIGIRTFLSNRWYCDQIFVSSVIRSLYWFLWCRSLYQFLWLQVCIYVCDQKFVSISVIRNVIANYCLCWIETMYVTSKCLTNLRHACYILIIKEVKSFLISGKCNCTRTKLFLSLSAEGAPSTTAEARVCTAVAALPDQLRGEGLKGAPHTAIWEGENKAPVKHPTCLMSSPKMSDRVLI